MHHFRNIDDYCSAIGTSPPRHSDFDIRTFEENMPTIVSSMPPFRHEFYAIALRVGGEGVAVSGHHRDFPDGSVVFFNTPFQLLSWDIAPDWQGYYIMFSQDFIAKSRYLHDLLHHFSFLKMDRTIPFAVGENQVEQLQAIYASIRIEYLSDAWDKFDMIESYVLLLLNEVRRLFHEIVPEHEAATALRKADLKLIARFQSLIETHFYPQSASEDGRCLHSPSFYARALAVHPNHLNAMVKQITGRTAKQTIQSHILHLAKTLLTQSEDSIKEVAYALHFETPARFSSFFKQHTGLSPRAYRRGVQAR